KRGDYVRRIGNAFRERKDELGMLVTLETGKILQEGLGEIQEAIDIADFAVGLSRQLYGLSMHSERPLHAMREQWHPLGTVGIISAFNFPAAVWAWNAMLALVCGDACVWKPSSKTPLTAIAMTNAARSILEPDGFGALVSLVIGSNEDGGERLVGDPLKSGTLCGPLIDRVAVDSMQSALRQVRDEGGKVILGGDPLRMTGKLAGGHFVKPAIALAENHYASVQTETFAPILYVIKV